MKEDIWHTLKKPIIALAPLANVTDAAFRRVIAEHSKPHGPDIFWTEFVSADGLYHTKEMQKLPDSENPLMQDLLYTEKERPIIAQFFTSKPEMMEYAAKLAVELGFDGIDINMGCPDRTVEKQCAGAALMKNPELAKEIVFAAKLGAGNLPVSVKTRIGYNANELKTWLPHLLATEPAAITIHARTRKEMSKVPARWEHVQEAVQLRDEYAKKTGHRVLILGNGDVESVMQGKELCKRYGADGVMLGRAIFGNPWRFNTALQEGELVPLEEKLRTMVEHTKLFEELLPNKNLAIMKKHYKAYVNNFDGAKELRERLMECRSAQAVEEEVTKFLSSTDKNSK